MGGSNVVRGTKVGKDGLSSVSQGKSDVSLVPYGDESWVMKEG